MQTQATPASIVAPAPVSEVIAIVTSKPGIAASELTKLAQQEVRGVVQLYLAGKVDQWYTRSDGRGSRPFPAVQDRRRG
jgi:hypothetical protein